MPSYYESNHHSYNYEFSICTCFVWINVPWALSLLNNTEIIPKGKETHHHKMIMQIKLKKSLRCELSLV